MAIKPVVLHYPCADKHANDSLWELKGLSFSILEKAKLVRVSYIYIEGLYEREYRAEIQGEEAYERHWKTRRQWYLNIRKRIMNEIIGNMWIVATSPIAHITKLRTKYGFKNFKAVVNNKSSLEYEQMLPDNKSFFLGIAPLSDNLELREFGVQGYCFGSLDRIENEMDELKRYVDFLTFDLTGPEDLYYVNFNQLTSVLCAEKKFIIKGYGLSSDQLGLAVYYHVDFTDRMKKLDEFALEPVDL